MIGGAGTLIGPTVGAAIWLVLRDVLQQVPAIGDLWKFILGVVFVILVTFMPNGVVGTISSVLVPFLRSAPQAVTGTAPVRSGDTRSSAGAAAEAVALAAPAPLALEARDISKAYGGIQAVDGVSLALPAGRFHAIIGPNGAGKSTFLRLLAREETAELGRNPACTGSTSQPPTSPRPINMGWPRATKSISYSRSSPCAQNLRIGALGRDRGRLRLDIFRPAEGFAKVEAIVAALMKSSA